jgi:hypothetical protein
MMGLSASAVNEAGAVSLNGSGLFERYTKAARLMSDFSGSASGLTVLRMPGAG